MTPGFPLIGLTGANDGTQLTSMLPSTQTQPTIGPQPSILDKVNAQIQKLQDAYNKLTQNTFLNAFFGSDYRYVTGTVGLILIIGGIFLFRPVRETIVEPAKGAAKTAVRGAVTAAITA